MFENMKSVWPIRAAIAAAVAGVTVLGGVGAANAQTYYYGPPAYYAPPARYYAPPPPVYYAPRPAYYAPPPVYYAPRPAYRHYYGAPRVNFGISVPLR